MFVAVGQSQSFTHAREGKKSRNKCPAKRFFSLSLNDIPIVRHWPWVGRKPRNVPRNAVGVLYRNTITFGASKAGAANAAGGKSPLVAGCLWGVYAACVGGTVWRRS